MIIKKMKTGKYAKVELGEATLVSDNGKEVPFLIIGEHLVPLEQKNSENVILVKENDSYLAEVKIPPISYHSEEKEESGLNGEVIKTLIEVKDPLNVDSIMVSLFPINEEKKEN